MAMQWGVRDPKASSADKPLAGDKPQDGDEVKIESEKISKTGREETVAPMNLDKLVAAREKTWPKRKALKKKARQQSSAEMKLQGGGSGKSDPDLIISGVNSHISIPGQVYETRAEEEYASMKELEDFHQAIYDENKEQDDSARDFMKNI